jgi:hypothetical protein
MARLRIYVDTSVIGGCFDAEFVTWSDALMRDFRAKRLVPVLSDVMAAEVVGAPIAVRVLHQELLGMSGGLLPVTPCSPSWQPTRRARFSRRSSRPK